MLYVCVWLFESDCFRVGIASLIRYSMVMLGKINTNLQWLLQTRQLILLKTVNQLIVEVEKFRLLYML